MGIYGKVAGFILIVLGLGFAYLSYTQVNVILGLGNLWEHFAAAGILIIAGLVTLFFSRNRISQMRYS